MSQMVTDYEYRHGSKLRLKIRPCPSCGEPHELTVGEYDYEKWADGVKSIEEAFPYLTPAERELLITGIDGNCFRKMTEEPDPAGR